MIVLTIPQTRRMAVTHLITGDGSLTRDKLSNKWNISPPWTMAERPTRQCRAESPTVKSLKSFQVNSDYNIFKMFCLNNNNDDAAYRYATKDDLQNCSPDLQNQTVYVGDLFVKEAHEGHDALQEEALEDGEGSKREHDTAW